MPRNAWSARGLGTETGAVSLGRDLLGEYERRVQQGVVGPK
jgi:hypothetical protein